MSDSGDDDVLGALKIAFTYMPRTIEVTRYTYGDGYKAVLEHIETVRQILLAHNVDPEEVYGEVHPHHTPRSSY